MNDQKFEELLRSAKPDASDIAPLSPEASTRILHAALRANRRPTRGIWLGMPWRVAMGAAAFSVLAFVLVPQTLVTDEAVRQTTQPIAPARTPTVAENTQTKTVVPTTNTKQQGDKKNTVARSNTSSLRTIPSQMPRRLHPSRMMAHYTPHDTVVASAHHTAPTTPAPVTKKPTPSEIPSDSGMYVAVSGANSLPPEEQSDEGLIVSVKKDVPDSVPGIAEAASLQEAAIPQEGATDAPVSEQIVPVWAHAHVESGAEAVVTLTALR